MKFLKFFGKLKKPKLLFIRYVVGTSMVPSLVGGQLIWATGRFKHLSSGDVVVVRHGDKEKIKRVGSLQPDKLYLLGDNPAASTDSRDFGWVDRSALLGKVIWPRIAVRIAEDSDIIDEQ